MSLHPAQRELVVDPSPHVSALCPRRAGKSYAGAAAALITGEAKPESISLIISLNLKQLKRLYWQGGPSGLFTLNRKFNLDLDFNKNELRWEHQNGSIGYLLGAEDPDQREVIRGMEADLYLVDECKSFAPRDLEELIDDIIDPQRATRRGRLILIGTPGNICAGPFYQATCDAARDPDGRPHSILFGTTDEWNRTADSHLLWSSHSWSLRDNISVPHQWEEALRKKASKRWSDDDPKWCREYLGHWAKSVEGVVYRYYDVKLAHEDGYVNWSPRVTDDNPTGLPPEGAPWHLVGGLDLGYDPDPTAFVLCGYSQVTRELRHIWDTSEKHLLPSDIADLIREAERKYGKIEIIYADTGKQLAAVLKDQHGLPVEHAAKRNKYDYIELLNESFFRGEIKIIAGTTLESQLIRNVWELRDMTLEEAVRKGRLIEDRNVPNDSTDALLYLHRGSHHRFGPEAAQPQPEYMSVEWFARWEKEQLRRARREVNATLEETLTARKTVDSVPTSLRTAVLMPRQRARISIDRRN